MTKLSITETLGYREAVEIMREAGINETRIGVVIQAVRSAVLNEEFRRIQHLISQNPPHHHTCFEMADAITETLDRPDD